MSSELHGNALTSASKDAKQLYLDLCAALKPLGPFREEAKKTSVHLARQSAFVGVQFGKAYLRITLKSDAPIESARIVKTEKISRNRWHCEMKITTKTDIDREMLAWAKRAYDLSD